MPSVPMAGSFVTPASSQVNSTHEKTSREFTGKNQEHHHGRANAGIRRCRDANWRPDRCDRVALVLQGGGALGAYQAGVYQALHEAGMEPDWVCGVSIGAINSAIIAGNPPERGWKSGCGFSGTASPRARSGTTRRTATSIARRATSPVRG
jgi:hypothetical protein